MYFILFFRHCAGTQTATTDFENADCCSNSGFDFDSMAELAAEEAFKKSSSSSFSWFRRVLKFALPVQFFVMMMLFLAWVRYFLCFFYIIDKTKDWALVQNAALVIDIRVIKLD